MQMLCNHPQRKRRPQLTAVARVTAPRGVANARKQEPSVVLIAILPAVDLLLRRPVPTFKSAPQLPISPSLANPAASAPPAVQRRRADVVAPSLLDHARQLATERTGMTNAKQRLRGSFGGDVGSCGSRGRWPYVPVRTVTSAGNLRCWQVLVTCSLFAPSVISRCASFFAYMTLTHHHVSILFYSERASSLYELFTMKRPDRHDDHAAVQLSTVH